MVEEDEVDEDEEEDEALVEMVIKTVSNTVTGDHQQQFQQVDNSSKTIQQS